MNNTTIFGRRKQDINHHTVIQIISYKFYVKKELINLQSVIKLSFRTIESLYVNCVPGI